MTTIKEMSVFSEKYPQNDTLLTKTVYLCIVKKKKDKDNN